MTDYTKELNQEQLAVVLQGEGPCLVLAGAGSGKTRVITYRVAYLLEQGVRPENILLVTFTNKAAAEMVSRVAALSSRAGSRDPSHSSRGIASSPPEADPRNDKEIHLPWAGTFHHIANKLLRHYAPLLGYKSNFTILDSDDSEALIKICAKGAKSDTKKFPSAAVLHNIISYARNAETTVEDVLEMKYPQWWEYAEAVRQIARDYEKKKKEANSIDFDDLLVNLLLLLDNEEFRNKYSSQFKYVLVDEYQDTNKIQASIIDKFASVHRNVLVVGDDAQSIYSFRAANVQNILQFEKRYPDAKIFKLETNYRSSQEILNLANNVIANNLRQYKKNLRTMMSTGLKPELHPRMDQGSEAAFVADKISQMLGEGVPAGQIAVLFRAAHHSQMLEMELVKAGITYDYRGGLRFFERAHVKDILSYLRIMNNIADTAAWMRVLLHEEGIGPVGANKIIENIRTLDIKDIAGLGGSVLGEKVRTGWNNFVRIWEAMRGAGENNPAILIQAVMESPYKEYLENEFVDGEERAKDIEQMAVFAEKYDSLESFLSEAALQESFSQRGLTQIKPRISTDNGSGKIVLSTIHQAKGLEWTAVFMINLSSNGFPNERALREENGLEEERRLFYVAITRAKKNLFLTYPMALGGAGDFLSGPSMFLSEISDGLLDDHSLLSYNTTVLDDEDEDVHYVPEDMPKKIRPGSFLVDIEEL